MNPAEFANIARAEQDFWWYRGMRRILFRLLDPLTSGRRFRRVLEAGCGTGHFAKALKERYACPVVAVDLGWEGLEQGKRLGVDSLAQADISSLPFEDGAFEMVVCLDVIVHFPRGKEDLPMDELTRVLQPGGLLAMRVSALDILRSRHSEFAHERQRFTRSRLTALAEKHGLTVLRCTYANSLLTPVAFVKFRIVETLTRAKPQSGVQAVSSWLDRLLFLPLACESNWIGRGRDLPLGQSLILLATKPSEPVSERDGRA